MGFMVPRFSIAVLLALALGTAALAADAPVPDAAPQVAEILKRLAPAGPDAVWDDARALEELGRPAIPSLKSSLADAPEGSRLAMAKALCSLGEGAAGCEALADLVRKGTPGARRVASRVLGEYGGTAAVKPLLDLLSDEALPRLQRVGVSAALWKRSQNMKAAQFCREALQDGDPDTRHAAALALGEMGQMTDARQPLEALALHPTEDGERARALLLTDRLAQTLAAQERPEVREGQALLAEIVGMVQRYYVDDAKTDLEDLFENAAKGLASALDPHSSYMGRKDVESMDERMEGHYAGVGAVVSRENGVLTIVSPFYDGPAYKAGIRSGDMITKIEGQNTADYSLEEAVQKLKGKPGTEVSIEIVRRGVVKPVAFKLTRAVISIKSVLPEMLPGDLGYVRLTQFAKQTGPELKAVLEGFRKQGMRGLILDLRGNGGGLLTAAAEVGDLFLKPGLLIVYSEGRNPEVAAREDYFSGGRLDSEGRWLNPPPGRGQGAPRPDYPMVVLVDHGSASASEIVSGALRDHGRAVLVGEKTFGKGSVQQLRHLESSGRETVLRLTVAKYYLPGGQCIHGIGVEPDIAVAQPDVVGWKFEEYRRLVDQDAFQTYFDQHPVKGDAALAALAVDDGSSWERYPGFGTWFDALKTPLSKEDVRLFLRRYLREKVAEDRGRNFETDLSDDVQLQRGVLEVLRRASIDPQTVPSYAALPAKFPPEPKATP